MDTEQPHGRAGREAGEPQLCRVPRVEPRTFPPDFDPERAAAILVSGDKWVNGTELRFHFVAAPADPADTEVVREAFEQWHDLGIGLSFREVADRNEAEVRIAFDHADGSWSYVGRQVLGRPATAPTMNFGWRLAGTGHGRDTALHEIGHTLGMPHEHQNPTSGIAWNEPAVLRHFAGPPNHWPPEVTRWNVLRKIEPDAVQGSAWDRDSIMHYPFAAGLIDVPEQYRTSPLVPAGGLSERDARWIRSFYPALVTEPARLVPFESQRLVLTPSEQADFIVEPTATRSYTFETVGRADTVLVLFEDVHTGEAEDRGLRFLAGDDDSGTDRNARFRIKLYKGRRYVVRVRLSWAGSTGEMAVLVS